MKKSLLSILIGASLCGMIVGESPAQAKTTTSTKTKGVIAQEIKLPVVLSTYDITKDNGKITIIQSKIISSKVVPKAHKTKKFHGYKYTQIDFLGLKRWVSTAELKAVQKKYNSQHQSKEKRSYRSEVQRTENAQNS